MRPTLADIKKKIAKYEAELLDERKNLNLDIDLLKEKVERNPKAIDVDLINDIQRDLAIISELNTVVRILKELGSCELTNSQGE